MKNQVINDVLSKVVPYFAVNDIDILEHALTEVLNDCDVVARKQVPVAVNVVSELVPKFIVAKQLKGCSKGTIDQYKYTLNKFFESTLKPPQLMTPEDISIYLYNVLANGGKDRYIDTIQSTLSSFFDWCELNDYIASNPMRKIERRKYIPSEILPLTENEIESIRLKYNKLCKRDRTLFEFMISSGCRASEVVNIEISSVNWDNKSIKIIGKGNKPRTVLMSERASLMLKDYIADRDNYFNAHSKYLFTTSRHPMTRMSVSTLEDSAKKLGNLIGIHLHPHMLRHTFATIAVDRGMPIEEVQALLGHSCLDTTMIYVKINKENIRYHYSRCVF